VNLKGVMASQFHPNGNTITVDNYDNALHIIKQKLYDGDYFTSTDSSINIAYDRKIHRYKVFPSKDISISINENPKSKQNFNSIRLLDIPTSSDGSAQCSMSIQHRTFMTNQ
jgi:hypothetical protein